MTITSALDGSVCTHGFEEPLELENTNTAAIGNQLTGTSIYEEEVKQKYNRYQASMKKTPRPPMSGNM